MSIFGAIHYNQWTKTARYGTIGPFGQGVRGPTHHLVSTALLEVGAHIQGLQDIISPTAQSISKVDAIFISIQTRTATDLTWTLISVKSIIAASYSKVVYGSVSNCTILAIITAPPQVSVHSGAGGSIKLPTEGDDSGEDVDHERPGAEDRSPTREDEYMGLCFRDQRSGQAWETEKQEHPREGPQPASKDASQGPAGDDDCRGPADDDDDYQHPAFENQLIVGEDDYHDSDFGIQGDVDEGPFSVNEDQCSTNMDQYSAEEGEFSADDY